MTVRTPLPDELGVLKTVEGMKDDEGRQVMRATIDFYDGNFPAGLTFGTVFNRTPVTIIEVRAHGESASKAKEE